MSRDDVRFHAELDFPDPSPVERLFQCKCKRGQIAGRIVYRHWILHEYDEYQECYEFDALVCTACCDQIHKSFIAMQWGMVEDGIEVE